jgi:alcohol dehydrogenase class IV
VTRPVGFEFSTAPLVVFGAGTLDRLADHAARLGRRAWLVTGAASLERSGILERVTQRLAAQGVAFERQMVSAEPDTAVVDEGARFARDAGCDLVVGIGGGSVLDTAKAVACLMANQGAAIDYLEVVGHGRKIERDSIPFIAVPTTAGTGSEVTRNAVLADATTGTKASLRDTRLLPRVAILDPDLTRGTPREVTARSGLDALIQLIEPYVSRRANPMIDALAIAGIRRATPALPRACSDIEDPEARADLLLAAMWSGMALAHCGLGACHALAGPLGGSFPIPHGVACAATMAAAMEANLDAAARDESGAETIRRYADVAVAMGEAPRETPIETARAGIERMRALIRELEIAGLGAFGVTPAAFPDLAARARKTSSMKANPVDLDDADLVHILEASL